MDKTFFIVAGVSVIGVGVIAAIIAAVLKYQNQHEPTEAEDIAYEDELTGHTLQEWFKDKLTEDMYKGIVFYFSDENLAKWKVTSSNQTAGLIQAVYDESADKIVAYREIAFSQLGDSLKKLLDENEGVFVVDR